MINSLKWCLCILFLMSALGCATYNSATGRNEVIFISTSSEVSLGNQLHRELSRKNKIIEDTDETKRLERIGHRLSRISDRQDFQYQFHLVDSNEVNAFTVPGGHVYFYTGLFRKLKTDNEIAAVLAHEIGHCAAKHTIKKFQSTMEYNVLRNVVMNVLAVKVPGIQNIAGLGADGIMNLAMTAYSRQDEYEADRLGIKYLYLSGFDINAMINVLEVLQEAQKGGGPPLILRTHPFVKDRIIAAQKEFKEVKAKY